MGIIGLTTPTFSASAHSAGQTGAVSAVSGTSVYEVSTGGQANISTNNTNAADVMGSIYDATAASLQGIANSTAGTAQAAAANPALIAPPGSGKTSIWLIIGAVATVGTLIWMVIRERR